MRLRRICNGVVTAQLPASTQTRQGLLDVQVSVPLFKHLMLCAEVLDRVEFIKCRAVGRPVVGAAHGWRATHISVKRTPTNCTSRITRTFRETKIVQGGCLKFLAMYVKERIFAKDVTDIWLKQRNYQRGYITLYTSNFDFQIVP